MKTIDEILAYLQQGIDSFDTDPPDSIYQRGYLAALKEVKTVIETGQSVRPKDWQ